MWRKPFKLSGERTRMRRMLFAVLVVALLAGCSARGGDTDPWAYTRKPLYASGFDLARIAGGTDSQMFQVTDGSIGMIRVLVWINATAGGGTVRIYDPGDRLMLTTSETVERQFGLELGQWRVEAEGQPESAGVIHVLAVRG